jgi:hypothetical protein
VHFYGKLIAAMALRKRKRCLNYFLAQPSGSSIARHLNPIADLIRPWQWSQYIGYKYRKEMHCVQVGFLLVMNQQVSIEHFLFFIYLYS